VILTVEATESAFAVIVAVPVPLAVKVAVATPDVVVAV